ncbi:MAG: hypothetical protein GY725_08275 [bacterium]|nr:hypothetical protein [bacterium]
MSPPIGRLREDVEHLRRFRSELKADIHLGTLETKVQFEDAETRWHQLDDRLRSISEESGESLHDVGKAARALVDEIHDSYRQIRGKLSS